MFEIVHNSSLTFKSNNSPLSVLKKSKYIILLFFQLNPNENLWFLKYYIM